MRFIIVPIEDMKVMFTEQELSTMRKSIDGTKVIVHEEVLLNKRNSLGLSTLLAENTGLVEWTYPTYNYNTIELNKLLNSKEWYNEINI